MAWGQFFTHDIDFTPPQTGDKAELLPIYIPKGDLFFDSQGFGNKTMNFVRSIKTEKSPREQINLLNSWFDGQMIYGIDKSAQEKLRTYKNGQIKLDSNELLTK